ncbi:PTS system, mannitol-specific IIA component [Pseudobutyrivibrio ruminis]|uniref:Mannitol-specific phosphotransferase enzyme IIA component n=1 Tax=Pseudobutyrivibrio ruminis TaxID=46206 RepID=A0A1H7HQU2_9FIRM|nr:PTS sugar transporter subunit IIA [Pseudobutyrivibrio ruminis]SEK52706.1 PTS system, mannitol-specific IIA component [Pseudobutyrivibrio ruminis]
MVLEKRNILLNQRPDTKENVIKRIGAIFSAEGYTDDNYTQAMLEKETIFNTYMGNFVALPHGIEAAKKDIRKTGIVLMTVPEGQEWGAAEKPKVIIGVAAVGDEHLEILSKIALSFSDADGIDRLLGMSEDDISAIFEG